MTTVTAPAAASAASSISTSSTTTAKPSQAMDSQMFLKLLTTQLRNQDPSSPMDSTQMISQTSQLASMEQLTSLNTSTTNSYDLQMRSAAANVLGKQVTWTGSDGAAKSGTVSAVAFSGSTPSLTVGADTVPLSDVTGVTEVAATAAA
jgi:flagellar basal-body rod modification protein FlgD